MGAICGADSKGILLNYIKVVSRYQKDVMEEIIWQ